MAVNYLSGNESPTAAKMNELWAEADSLFDKAMDGKSTFLLFREKVDSDCSPHLFRGKEFWFYTASDHQSDDLSVLYPIYNTMPAAHNQSTYDTAVSGASYAIYDSTNEWALTTADINIDQTLKAHTTTNGGNTYYVWDKGQPAPCKKWRYAVAEIVIGNAASNIFEFSNDYDLFNCFKIHNLTANQITFYFGTASSNHYSLTIPAYSQKCVRRDSVTSGYDSSYKYLFKCKANDPRYLFFDSHSGSVAQTMRANNITNASFLYNLMEHIGGDGFAPESVSEYNGWHHRITYDPHVWNDIGSDYSAAGYIPAIADSTEIAEIAFTKGDISYYRAVDATSTPEVGTITFDGFSGFTSVLSAIGLSGSVPSGSSFYTIARSTSHDYFYLWGKTTNLLFSGDQNRFLVLGTSHGGAFGEAIETELYYPNLYASPQYIDTYQNRDNGTSYNGAYTDVEDFWDYLDTNTNANCVVLADSHSSGIRSVILTTEGPVALYVDSWQMEKSHSRAQFGIDGFNISNYYDVIDDGQYAKILVKQYVPLHADRYRPGGSSSKRGEYRKGWPSKWRDSVIRPAANSTDTRHSTDAHKFHRMFEGPRKVRRYETTTGNYPHLEIANDPAGAAGADFTQNDTGTLTDTEISVQTSDISATVELFSAGYTDIPNYPRMVINDGTKALEDVKSTSTTVSDLVSASTGNANEYCRLNLLKEHFNDLVCLLKKANKIRPLAFDEIHFGNARPAQLGDSGTMHVLNNYLAPMDAYSGFNTGSDMEALFIRLGMTEANGLLKTEADFPDDIHADASSGGTDETALANYRWVKIDDVKTKAAAMGFKFRFEEMATPLKYVGSKEFDTTAVEADSKWKFHTTVACVTGATFMSGLTFTTYTIGTEFSGTTSTTEANRAIKFHLYDTSRTETGARCKVVFATVDSGLNRNGTLNDFMASYTTDEKYLTPPSASYNFIFLAQVTPPVTHSA